MTDTRIENALRYASNFGGIDGGHHKQWVIDQMVRALTGCPMVAISAKDCNGLEYEFEAQDESDEYRKFVADRKAGEDGPNTYDWEEGIAP